jgi:cell wall-associated NlpC family hydrolase
LATPRITSGTTPSNDNVTGNIGPAARRASRGSGASRVSRRTGALAALLLALVGFVVVPVGTASADPHISPAAARRELTRIDAEVDAAVEDYDQARIDLATAQRTAANVQAKVRRAERELTALRAKMGGFASAAYQSGGMDSFVTLLSTSNPNTFLDQATALDQIARDQAGQLRQLKAAARKFKAQQDAARAAVEATRAVERRMATLKHEVESKLARQQRLLDIVETRAARAARAAREADAARRARATRSTSRARYSGPASGRASVAVAEAYRQLGKPYHWGSAGPNSFDCSGLMMWVWGKAGVSLPHSSRAQYGYGTHVSRDELQPGDLVFFGSPIHHVGIYVGGGQYIAAPHSGDVVGFRSMGRDGYAGATRL